MVKTYLFISFLVLTYFSYSQVSVSQSAEEWLKTNNYFENPDFIFEVTTSSLPSKMSEQEKESFIKKEKEKANKALRSKISWEFKNVEYDFISFNNLENYNTIFDKKSVSTVCVINRKSVSEVWLKDMIRKYDELKRSLNLDQVTGKLTSETIDAMLNNARIKWTELKRYEDIAFKLNPQLQLFEIELYKTDILGKINELNNLMDDSIFNDKLKVAQSKLQKRDVYGAYADFKILIWNYPNKSQVISGMSDAHQMLVDIYDKKITKFEQAENYDAGLKTIDSLFRLDYDLEKEFTPRYNEIKKLKFNSICLNTEKILSYKTVSGEQLKSNLTQLKVMKDIDIDRYTKIKEAAEERLIDYDLKILRSYVYNKNFTKALSEIPNVKLAYEKSRKIEAFEKEMDKKIYHHFKQNILKQRPNLYSIESSLSVMSPPSDIDFLDSNYYNLNLMYSLGVYRRLGIKQKVNRNGFKYTTLGVKLDYLSTEQTFNPNDTTIYNRNNSFINPQLSLGLRNALYIDLGYLAYDKFFEPSLYTGSIGLFIPLGNLGIGINAKYLTDFSQTQMIMGGASIKLNFGIKKKFNSSDKMEIQTSILKLKQ